MLLALFILANHTSKSDLIEQALITMGAIVAALTPVFLLLMKNRRNINKSLLQHEETHRLLNHVEEEIGDEYEENSDKPTLGQVLRHVETKIDKVENKLDIGFKRNDDTFNLITNNVGSVSDLLKEHIKWSNNLADELDTLKKKINGPPE